jgi:hypothetical protein
MASAIRYELEPGFASRLSPTGGAVAAAWMAGGLHLPASAVPGAVEVGITTSWFHSLSLLPHRCSSAEDLGLITLQKASIVEPTTPGTDKKKCRKCSVQRPPETKPYDASATQRE